MYVWLTFKTKDGKTYRTKSEMKVSEARKYFKEKLKNDDVIIYVDMRYFDGWRTKIKEIMKDMKEK